MNINKLMSSDLQIAFYKSNKNFKISIENNCFKNLSINESEK